MSQTPDYSKTPNHIPWPPILLGLSLLGAYLLGRLFPVEFGQNIPVFGIALIAVAFTLDIWAFQTFRRHRTEIMPHKPARQLVTSGPFRYSRNPIYVGNVLIILGLGAITGSIWFLPAALVFVMAVTQLAIIREERHLAALFGEEWEVYAARVRRWL